MKKKKTKKILLIILIVILVAIVSTPIIYFIRLSSKKLTTASGEVVVFASHGALCGTQEDMAANQYTITTDKVLTYTREIVDVVPGREIPSVSRELTQEEYDALIQLVTHNGILLLPSDITDPFILDGGYAHLSFTMEDGTEFSTGGDNPNNNSFKEVLSYIKELVTEDMEEEYEQKYEEYTTAYSENGLYYDYSVEIAHFNLSITQEQLEKLEEPWDFFLNLGNAEGRLFRGTYHEASGSYVYEDNYELIIGDDTADVYVCGDYVGTFHLVDMKDLYQEDIEKFGIIASEEQLRIGGRQFMTDVRHLNQSAYAYLLNDFSKGTLTMDEEDIESGIRFDMPDYRFVLEDGNWIYYIQDEKAGSMAYIPPTEYYKEEIEKYNITCPDSWFFTKNFNDIFFNIESLLEKGEINSSFMTYNEETNTYYDESGENGTISYSFKGVSDTQYDIIVDDEKIGSFIVD